jgi:hypothetical protein
VDFAYIRRVVTPDWTAKALWPTDAWSRSHALGMRPNSTGAGAQPDVASFFIDQDRDIGAVQEGLQGVALDPVN